MTTCRPASVLLLIYDCCRLLERSNKILIVPASISRISWEFLAELAFSLDPYLKGLYEGVEQYPYADRPTQQLDQPRCSKQLQEPNIHNLSGKQFSQGGKNNKRTFVDDASVFQWGQIKTRNL